jgi:two-component system, OmpR family, sensor histidine kinase ChvG
LAWVVSLNLAYKKMKKVAFIASVRAKFLVASLVLLLIPIVGFLFVRELAGYLRSGQEQVAVAAARLVAASLSDRAEINLRHHGGAATNDATPIKTEAELERERIVALFQVSDPETVAALGGAYRPDTQVERILNQSGLKGSAAESETDARIWVIDASGQVRGLVGAIAASSQKSPGTDLSTNQKLRAWLAPITRMVMPLILPIQKNTGGNNDNTAAVMSQAVRATIGQPTVEWRSLNEKMTLLSAAAPIWQADNVVAAVVIEETDRQYRSVAKNAAESVIVMTLIVFIVVFGVLVGFALRFASRLSRLQREANRAVDAQGRVRGEIRATNDRDEIGALNETLRAMVSRQASYNSYLEQLAARLSHELRTPVAVVRSSLDNLRASALTAEDNVFLARADEGVARLSQIISRMSEATQLERMLQGAQRESIDIVALIGGCVAGYQQTFLNQRFIFTHDLDRCSMAVVPDAIAQMLDKLIQNAIDFASTDTPIRVTITSNQQNATIAVENQGTLLPSSAKEVDALFDSMVSKRAADSHEAHLGLGLYIARLIAEFHGGGITAENLRDGSGVRFSVLLPRSA